MKIAITKSNLLIKASLLILAVLFSFSPGQIGFIGFNINAQQVMLDSHSKSNGSATWNITTHYPNELIIMSSGGYSGGGNTLPSTPGTVTVNGNNATYINRGSWINNSFTWVESIWAYMAPTAGTYTCVCTEHNLISPYYFNFASSVYQDCPLGLNLGNIIKGGSDSNHGPTTISASITTTKNGAWIYGSIDNNDNGGTGIVKWNGQLTQTDFTYISDGIDGDQADSTYVLAGTYSITSTDIGASNVWMTIALIAVQPNANGNCCTLTATANVISNENCYGDKIGSAYGIPANGHSPYTYSWTPGGQTTDTVSGLSAGTYSIVISDTIGCSATATVSITQPAILSAAPTVSNVLCNGGTGSAASNVTGGTSAYTYSWTPTSQTTATATGLSIGTYTVDITDNHGCTATSSVSITQPPQLTASIATPTYPLCYGQTGSAVSSGIGGTPAYTYSWSPIGGSAATGTGLIAGTYTVTIKDNNGCTATTSVVITQPTIVAGSITATTYPVCNGNTGSATVKATGGVPGYTYLWSPSAQTTTTATGLLAGVYTVTITDASSCIGTVIATITQPTQVVANIVNIADPPCNGNTGSATAGATGGVSQYTYKWTPGNQTKATATGLIAGVYTVTVSDSSGCTGTTTATLTQPATLTATISATNYPICNGGTGNATVTAAGGTIPYTYLWSPGTQTTAAATGLSAGAYTIKVTDIQGCTATNTVTITQPVPFTVTMGTPTYILCYGEKSNVTVAASGGTNPYTYMWTPSAETTALATGLSAGTYSVSITDAHNCTGTATVTITQPALVTAAITSTTGISCTNGNNGTAMAKGAGGVPPYIYLWTPSTETTATATGLFAVSYTVSITDANGCTATATTTLTQPTPVTAFISEPKIICKDSTGILVANPGGGTPGYKYAWSSGATTSIATVTPIFTNAYSVTVTDANGCMATATIALQYGASFAVDIGGRKSVCVGDSTTLCANTIGAIDGIVKYVWQPANNGSACINVTPSSTSVYTVMVEDGCGSSTTASTTVYTEPIPSVNMDVNFSSGCLPFCVQFLNSSTVSSGNIGQYTWSFGDGDSTHTKQPVYCYKTSGAYNVSLTVVSDSGCDATLSRTDMITVYSSPKAAFTYSPQPVTILTPTIQFTDESIDSYGLAYRWWTFGDGSDSVSNLANPTHTYADTGSYCATLIEMNNRGCMDTVTNCLIIEPAFNLYIPSAFTPNGDNKNEVFQPVGQYVKSFEMYIFDRWGMELFHSTSINQGWNGTVKGGPPVQEDTYIYKVTVTDSEDNQHSYVGNVTLLK